MSTTKIPDYDIAIIGGGASGIYTAWRMLLEGEKESKQIQKWMALRGGKLKIAVFEGSDRIGGRVLSAKAPGLPGLVCEIGGMRYVSSQTLVKSLVENKFKLKTHQQAVDEPNNLCYLRGKRIRNGDLDNPKKLPYNLSKKEKKWLSKVPYLNTAANLLSYAVQQVLPGITNSDLLKEGKMREWLRSQVDPNTNVPLYKTGFWNLIAPVLSNEAYELAITTVGYDCLGFNTNAVDTICELFDFTPDVQYYLLNDGYESLIWKMQEEFQNAGGEIIMNKWLKGFDEIKLEDKSKGVTMEFRDNGESFKTTLSITARAIVLAMPQRSLNLLERKGPVLDENKAPEKVRYLLNSVEPVHLYKMFIAYPEAWWEKKGVSKGRSITDIPVRQCYYWGQEKGSVDDPSNKNAILMVYNDAKSSDFWGGLRHRPLGPNDTITNFSNKLFQRVTMPFAKDIKEHNKLDKKLYKNWEHHPAPKDMVHEMHKQLLIMHGIKEKDAPAPLEAAFMDWGDDPYGGAVHFWNPGYNSTEVMNEIVKPVDDFHCYICGEAYSTTQTWVEGALQTAELVLKKFGFDDPKWIEK